MSPSKPLPRTLEPDDERKVQTFLERASSIVLEQRVLDARHWRSLVELAKELDLTDEQLRATVHDLQQRGVISRIDLDPPKPPPLPDPHAVDSVIAEEEPTQESTFALTPPSRPKRPPPPPRAPAKSPVAEMTEAAALEQLQQRAASIIAEQRGVSPRALALISAAAKELNLSEEAVAQALQRLTASSPMPAPAEAAAATESLPEPKSGRRRWRVEGEPGPEPPPASRKPEETYRDFLNSSLARIANGLVPTSLEDKLLMHGKVVLGLAPTFARHLLREEAERKGAQLESVVQEDQSDSIQTRFSDPKIKTFLDRAGPILSLHQGITARSRVLLNALAHELGLSEPQLEEALAAAQYRGAAAEDKAEAWQQERLVDFRSVLQGTLASLPRKVLTPDIARNLLRHGEESHGIRADLATAAIREACKSLGIGQISEQQAREHIEQLVDARLVETPRLVPQARERIQLEGDQWGLTGDETAQIIEERSRLHQQRHRTERHITNAALAGAGVMLFLLVVFFVWIWIEQRFLARSSAPMAPSPLPRAPAATVVADPASSWLSPALQSKLAYARADFADLGQPLAQVGSNQADERISAYGRLVDELLAEPLAAAQQQSLIEVLSDCYAADPDDAAARHILEKLLVVVPQTPDELRADDALYRQAFLATRVAVALATSASDQRQAVAAASLGQKLGQTINVGLARVALEQECLSSVARRFYELLTALTTTEPTLVAGIHRVLVEQAAAYLDAIQLEQLNTDLLVALLSVPGDTWQEFRPLIQSTIELGSPIHVVRLLELYERSTDTALQDFMGERFLRRARAPTSPTAVAAVAREVRKALGVNETVTNDQRVRRFVEAAEKLLAQPRVSAGDSPRVLEEIVHLGYLATLGCALSQGAGGATTFDTLTAQDPAQLLSPPESAADDREPRSALEPTSHTFLNNRLTVLNPRTSAVRRAEAIESIAGMAAAGEVVALAPEQSQRLAEYLLMRKQIDEHKRVLQSAPALARWKGVRLALADQLDDVGLEREQLQQLVAKLLSRDYTLGEGAAGREALRVELLQSVLADAQATTDRGKFALYDEAAKVLRQFYVTQGTLLRLSTGGEEPTPTAILPELIASLGERLATGKLDAAQRPFLGELRPRLQAIDYVAANDLQRLALLERLWLELLAISVGQTRGDHQAAQSLVEVLAAQDRDSSHVLTQIRDGQVAIVRMWLLSNQHGEGAR